MARWTTPFTSTVQGGLFFDERTNAAWFVAADGRIWSFCISAGACAPSGQAGKRRRGGGEIHRRAAPASLFFPAATSPWSSARRRRSH